MADSSGYGEPGSPYSNAMANQSSPSDLGQTRKYDLGNGSYIWQRMDSVTGQWVNMGQPIPNNPVSNNAPVGEEYDFNSPSSGVMIYNPQTKIVEPGVKTDNGYVPQSTVKTLSPNPEPVAPSKTSFDPFKTIVPFADNYGRLKNTEAYVLPYETPVIYEPGGPNQYYNAVGPTGKKLDVFGGYDPIRRVFVTRIPMQNADIDTLAELMLNRASPIDAYGDLRFYYGESRVKELQANAIIQQKNSAIKNDISDMFLGRKANAASVITDNPLALRAYKGQGNQIYMQGQVGFVDPISMAVYKGAKNLEEWYNNKLPGNSKDPLDWGVAALPPIMGVGGLAAPIVKQAAAAIIYGEFAAQHPKEAAFTMGTMNFIDINKAILDAETSKELEDKITAYNNLKEPTETDYAVVRDLYASMPKPLIKDDIIGKEVTREAANFGITIATFAVPAMSGVGLEADVAARQSIVNTISKGAVAGYASPELVGVDSRLVTDYMKIDIEAAGLKVKNPMQAGLINDVVKGIKTADTVTYRNPILADLTKSGQITNTEAGTITEVMNKNPLEYTRAYGGISPEMDWRPTSDVDLLTSGFENVPGWTQNINYKYPGSTTSKIMDRAASMNFKGTSGKLSFDIHTVETAEGMMSGEVNLLPPPLKTQIYRAEIGSVEGLSVEDLTRNYMRKSRSVVSDVTDISNSYRTAKDLSDMIMYGRKLEAIADTPIQAAAFKGINERMLNRIYPVAESKEAALTGNVQYLKGSEILEQAQMKWHGEELTIPENYDKLLTSTIQGRRAILEQYGAKFETDINGNTIAKFDDVYTARTSMGALLRQIGAEQGVESGAIIENTGRIIYARLGIEGQVEATNEAASIAMMKGIREGKTYETIHYHPPEGYKPHLPSWGDFESNLKFKYEQGTPIRETIIYDKGYSVYSKPEHIFEPGIRARTQMKLYNIVYKGALDETIDTKPITGVPLRKFSDAYVNYHNTKFEGQIDVYDLNMLKENSKTYRNYLLDKITVKPTKAMPEKITVSIYNIKSPSPSKSSSGNIFNPIKLASPSYMSNLPSYKSISTAPLISLKTPSISPSIKSPSISMPSYSPNISYNPPSIKTSSYNPISNYNIPSIDSSFNPSTYHIPSPKTPPILPFGLPSFDGERSIIESSHAIGKAYRFKIIDPFTIRTPGKRKRRKR